MYGAHYLFACRLVEMANLKPNDVVLIFASRGAMVCSTLRVSR